MSLSEVRVGRIPNYMKEIKPKIEKKIYRNKFCLSLKHYAKFQRFDWQILAEPKQIMPNTFYTEKYLNSSNQSQIIVLSLLRDKSYQIFIEQAKEFEDHEKKARKLIETNFKPKKIANTSEIIFNLKRKNMKALMQHASSLFQIIHLLPGFQRIGKQDLSRILSDGFFIVFGVRSIKLFINNDYFFMLDENTPMNSDLFALLTSEAVRDSAFEFYSNFQKLNLTDQEYALLIPIFLTMFSKHFKIKNLNYLILFF